MIGNSCRISRTDFEDSCSTNGHDFCWNQFYLSCSRCWIHVWKYSRSNGARHCQTIFGRFTCSRISNCICWQVRFELMPMKYERIILVVLLTPYIQSLLLLSILFFFQGISQGLTDLGRFSSLYKKRVAR